MTDTLDAARTGDTTAFEALVAPYRKELRAHCYRMAGSLHDADDLLQESLLRAWRGLSGFEGRSSVRTWLHRVTTNTCLDQLERKSARMLPMDLGPAGTPDEVGPPSLDVAWLEPCPSAVYAVAPSPEAALDARQSVALAFLVALQALPARQRAVLLLRDVVGWEAAECAAELGMSVAAVNSALQRARETVSARRGERPSEPVPDEVLARYVKAWETADVAALVTVLREDATLAMPPIPTWLQGRDAIAASLRAMVLPAEAAGQFRLVRTEANGQVAFLCHGPDGRPVALHVLDFRDGQVAGILAFADPGLLYGFV